ncbi:MAG: RlmE family RNA methyltransferase [Deltaproteobacteria bacterium]|nr:RlmE family RNA methyltransferase [Deltaproteobacteria bacterium]MBI3389806.1 RlmE family RNA methyltransferase [Deltaproteobacteria bacterium]
MYQRKDAFYARAKAAGYRSRAAYKLIELDQRFHLLHSGDHVVDLGAWPGGWLQVAAERVGPRGVVVGVDLKPIDSLSPPVVCVVGDVREIATLDAVRRHCADRVDAVLSDLAPKLSGVRATDAARAAELGDVAMGAAESLLCPGGRLLMKLFQGAETATRLRRLRERFGSVKVTRPEATRSGSAEIYVAALGFRAQPLSV